MAESVKLSDLPIGASAIVRELPKSGMVRLREMGLLAGTRVTFVRCAPFGDPIEIKVRGYHLSLRKSEAARVIVERDEP
ncbi:MAG: FeoA family protein [Opitutaceae bacterium]|jgi:ferrous iron transport protein A